MAIRYKHLHHRQGEAQRLLVRAGTVATLVALVGGGVLTAGCSSGSASTSTTSSPPPGSSRSSTTNPATAHVLVATFADNGGTLTVQVHARIRVVLAGISWTQTSSDPSVLRSTGKATILAPSTGCVTGQGCGSVTVFYQALKVGDAQVLGYRGELPGRSCNVQNGPGGISAQYRHYEGRLNIDELGLALL